MSQQDKKTKEDDEYFFGKGGKLNKKQFKELLDKYGLSEEQGKAIVLKNGGLIRKYADGDPIATRRMFDFSPVSNQYLAQYNNEFGKQSRTGYGYGKVDSAKTLSDRLQEQATLYPLLESEGIVINNNGTYQFGDGRGEEDIQDFLYSSLSAATGIAPIRNNDSFQTYLQEIGFNGSRQADTDPRFLDTKYGDFTSTRPSYSINLLTERELNQLNNAGITHYSQLFSDEGTGILGEDRVNQLRDFNQSGNQRLDFILGSYNDEPDLQPLPPTPFVRNDLPVLDGPERISIPQTPPTTTNPPASPGPDSGNPPSDDDRRNVSASLGFISANRTELPPAPLQIPSMSQVRLNRIDAPRASTVNPELANIEYNVAMGLQDVPDSQAGAISSSLAATLGEASNRYFADASGRNVSTQLGVDQYNAGIGDRETITNTQLASDYERLAQMATENTYNEWADYYGNASMMNAQRLADERTFNMINNLFDNYKLSGSGEIGYNGTNNAFGINMMNALRAQDLNAAKMLLSNQKTPNRTSRSNS